MWSKGELLEFWYIIGFCAADIELDETLLGKIALAKARAGEADTGNNSSRYVGASGLGDRGC